MTAAVEAPAVPLPGVPAVPVTVLAGPAGIGRSTALARLRARAEERGTPVVGVRLSPPEIGLPFHLASRLAGEISALPGGFPLSRALATPHPAGDGRPGLDRQVAVLAAGMAAHPGLCVLVDDAQWIDEGSLAVLDRTVRLLPRSTAYLICAVRTPAAAGRPLLERLCADGLARVRTLRPLSRPEIDGVVTDLVKARPHPSFSRHLRRASRGRPAMVHAVVEAYRRSGALSVVDQRVRLTGNDHPLHLPETHAVLAPIRALPAPAWAVAKAVAVLHPLGGAVPELAGTALGLTPPEIAGGLAELVGAGVLRLRRRAGESSWRFAVPMLAPALRSQLGPFERRSLARAAVDALWAGTAPPAGPAYLADRLAEAGRLVESGRAARELVAAGTSAAVADGRAAARWLSAAAELSAEPAERARVLLARARVRALRGDFPAAAGDARLLLGRYAADLPRDAWPEALLIHVAGLRGSGDVAAVERIADGTDRLPGPAGTTVAARAAALATVGRLPEADRLLADAAHAGDDGTAKELAEIVATLCGRPAPPPAPGEAPPRLVAARVRVLAMLGAPDAAERLLQDRGLAAARLPELDQALLAWRRGRWDEALDLAGLGLPAPHLAGFEPGHGALCHAAALVHLGRGRPARARALLTGARAGRTALPQLLDLAEAQVERALGAERAAGQRVAAGLAAVAASGTVPGAAELWLLHTELAVARADVAEARRGVHETGRLAEATGLPYTAVHHLLARAAADRDNGAAAEAVLLARGLGQPFLLAQAAERAVAAGGDAARLLAEAHELYGALDAGLHACWVRNLMRAHDVSVPRRTETVVENERLLATLVAEGASNREAATVLRTSEKSVENRLTRLFARTGCRSRVELAAAVITGGYGKG
ncbi:AAA family ATPase [Micromonospora sp. KLBMP9576]|uniref:helix-turn-helix transcriptional regulator n=1 Tax=Micromonospora sp. KLBMP9576 TaxID=3424769 RepID=UPI003D8A1CB9